MHNNSKHGRRQPSFREAVVGDGQCKIFLAIVTVDVTVKDLGHL